MLFRSMKFLLLLGGLGALVFGLSAPLRADATNLLPVPGIPEPNQNPASSWVFSAWNANSDPTAKGKVDGKISTDTDGHQMLTVASTESLKSIQMWWQAQNVTCAGGASYQLSVSVKGTVRTGTARPTIGVYFMDATRKWIGFQEISGVPPTLPSDWQKIEGSVVAPENAVTMGVRIGVVYTEGDADISYKDPILATAAATTAPTTPVTPTAH